MSFWAFFLLHSENLFIIKSHFSNKIHRGLAFMFGLASGHGKGDFCLEGTVTEGLQQ